MKHDKKAERSLLGIILLKSKNFRRVHKSGILISHFRYKDHQIFFMAMLSLYEKKREINLVSLAAMVKKQGLSKIPLGPGRFTRLFEEIFATKDLGLYIEAVKKPYKTRKLRDDA